MLGTVLKGVTTTKAATYLGTTSTSNGNIFDWFSGAATALIVLAIFAIIIGIAVAVLIIVSNCKIFSKAGEKWWKALIPMYNSWVETRIAGLAWYWFVIFAGLTAALVGPKANYVLSMLLVLTSYNYCYNMAKRFGKSTGFAVLMALLPVIGLPMLAFGSAKFDANAKVDKNGIFSIEK